jgi:hypothetical protein
MEQTKCYIQQLKEIGLDHIAYDLQSLNYYREAMDKMCEILKDTETPFENDDGEKRFYGIEELVPLAEDYKKCKNMISPASHKSKGK